MNGRKAKFIRKLTGFVPSAKRSYERRLTPKSVSIPDGEGGTKVVGVSRVTFRNSPASHRAIYQAVKRGSQ